jgi:translation initiation factor 4A
MAGETNFDAKGYDQKMQEYIAEGGEAFFTEWEESYDSFDQMGLHENLLRGVYAYGFGSHPPSSRRVSCRSPRAWT